MLWLFCWLLPWLQPRAVDPALRPPKGAQVALVVFEDLQCPDCRRAAPLVEEAARTYKIPVVRHDFPLPMHNWSYDAAIIARYFDSQSKELGMRFATTFSSISRRSRRRPCAGLRKSSPPTTKWTCPSWSIRKASWQRPSTRTRTPGQRVGINHTPTIYVVSNKTQGKPFVEVVDRTQLFQLIDAMKNE